MSVVTSKRRKSRTFCSHDGSSELPIKNKTFLKVDPTIFFFFKCTAVGLVLFLNLFFYLDFFCYVM